MASHAVHDALQQALVDALQDTCETQGPAFGSTMAPAGFFDLWGAWTLRLHSMTSALAGLPHVRWEKFAIVLLELQISAVVCFCRHEH